MSTEIEISYDEVEAALAGARGFGWTTRDQEEIPSAEMGNVLRIAYERNSVTDDARERRSALERDVERLRVTRDEVARELSDAREARRAILDQDEVADHVRRLLTALVGAWWLEAAESYQSLKDWLEEADE